MVAGRRVDPSPSLTTPARILEAAELELLRTNGQLEMQAVARAAGVVPSVVSHHFGSRSGVVNAVVDAFFDRLHEEVLDRDLRPLGSWIESEHARVRMGVRFYYTEPLAPIVYGSLGRDAEVASREHARVALVVESTARNIAAAQRTGELPRGVDPKLASAAIYGAARQVTVTALGADRRPPQRVVVDQLWRMTVAAVTPHNAEERA